MMVLIFVQKEECYIIAHKTRGVTPTDQCELVWIGNQCLEFGGVIQGFQLFQGIPYCPRGGHQRMRHSCWVLTYEYCLLITTVCIHVKPEHTRTLFVTLCNVVFLCIISMKHIFLMCWLLSVSVQYNKSIQIILCLPRSSHFSYCHCWVCVCVWGGGGGSREG